MTGANGAGGKLASGVSRARAAKRLRRWAVILFALVVLWLCCGWVTVAFATAPRHARIAALHEFEGRAVVDVHTVTDDGVDVRAWWIDAGNDRAVVVLAGIGGNRSAMLGRAASWLRRGWSVVLPDLRGTGVSGGDRIGMGYLERRDVLAWVRFLHGKGMTRVGLHGQSLGAAAIAYAVRDFELQPAFLVLDSCYDSLHNTLVNRLPWVPLPGVSFLPIAWFGALALGTDFDGLRPDRCLAQITCPVLFFAGDRDTKVLPQQTLALFASCGSVRKRLVWIDGAGHEDLWRKDAGACEAALDELLR